MGTDASESDQTRLRAVREYRKYWKDDSESKDTLKDQKLASKLSNLYYESSTWLYELGWGYSFHFGRMYKGLSFKECLLLHEFYLFNKLGIKSTDVCADIGCGIGGPLRQLIRIYNCSVYGINNCTYQIRRFREINESLGLADKAKLLCCDFSNIDLPSNSVDKAYSIEATCHAENLESPYAEIFRILKPGGRFGCYEWVLTNKYDPNDKEMEHHLCDIREGNSLVKLHKIDECLAAIKKVGFNIIETDVLSESDSKRPDVLDPWYSTLKKFETANPLEKVLNAIRPVTDVLKLVALGTAEKVGLAVPGAMDSMKVLIKAGNGLTVAGRAGVYTTMFMFIVEKPKEAATEA